jgi:FKBP-type peptidyl-prolyl cis-trans isomerase FklB
MAMLKWCTPLPLLVLAACHGPEGTVGEIELSYKRDARVVDPYRGLGAWVAGPGYSGATAQETVVARARALDGKGKPVAARVRWIPSDPRMVTASPGEGGEVTIGVHHEGDSRLTIAAGKLSRDLIVRAERRGSFLVFEIAPAPGPAAKAISPTLEGRAQQVSYAVGLNLARTLQKQSVAVDPDLVRQGFKDALSGAPTRMSEAQAHALLIGVETEINVTEAGLSAKQVAEKNRADGERFLAENRKKAGVVQLPSGLQYQVLTAGRGARPTPEDVAVCQYRGMYLDGTEFDSSYARKTHEPVRFPVKGVIKAWQEALQMMPAGSRWRLFVPPGLAYGERGVPRSKIGPNTTLVFEVELLAVEASGTRQRLTTANHPNAEISPQLVDQLKRAVRGLSRERRP